jgi:chromodomain-helicase-DNA-binding protein 7
MTLKTEHRVLLSGTPLQNNIGELFNLLEYLDPNKFTASMRENFSNMFAKSLLVKDHEAIFKKD